MKTPLILLPLFLLSFASGTPVLFSSGEFETENKTKEVPPAPSLDAEFSRQLSGDFSKSDSSGMITYDIKGNDKIRITIFNESQTRSFKIVWNNGSLHSVVEKGSGSSTIQPVAPEDQAEYLFDLIVPYPVYYLQTPGQFDQTHPILDGYRLELDNAEPESSAPEAAPTYLRLYKVEGNTETLVKEAEYLEYHPESDGRNQPRLIHIRNPENDDVTKILIHTINTDPILPDFLFE